MAPRQILDAVGKQQKACLRELRASGILTDIRVEKAMLGVPREKFVPLEYMHRVWADHALPIGFEQTISAPHMYAIMLQAADLQPGQKVLEIGTGSGYGAALLKEMVGPGGAVYSVELDSKLAAKARKILSSCQYDVKVIVGDGYFGYSSAAPYDRILVTALADSVPSALWKQLSFGGNLLIPIGGEHDVLMKYEKTGSEIPTGIELCGVMFVPLKHGKVAEPK